MFQSFVLITVLLCKGTARMKMEVVVVVWRWWKAGKAISTQNTKHYYITTCIIIIVVIIVAAKLAPSCQKGRVKCTLHFYTLFIGIIKKNKGKLNIKIPRLHSHFRFSIAFLHSKCFSLTLKLPWKKVDDIMHFNQEIATCASITTNVLAFEEMLSRIMGQLLESLETLLLAAKKHPKYS